ncbi:hypothetical protein AVEN_213609-1 [Araneus ventricosus]|uniref:Uncharacterized protein n=1 Tax=Araneus ventricosus TaxID=182803 RepID=A0A4Y2LMR5_ARAVE|nr:hypothetical protein AVEN_213609-1 [Araneus ventricosus]
MVHFCCYWKRSRVSKPFFPEVVCAHYSAQATFSPCFGSFSGSPQGILHHFRQHEVDPSKIIPVVCKFCDSKCLRLRCHESPGALNFYSLEVVAIIGVSSLTFPTCGRTPSLRCKSLQEQYRCLCCYGLSGVILAKMVDLPGSFFSRRWF